MSAPLAPIKRQYFIARNPDVTPAQIALAKAAPYDRLVTAMHDMGDGVIFIASGEIVSYHERHAWLLERRGKARMSAIPDLAAGRGES